MSHINTRYTPNGHEEGHFRRDVRDALALDVFTRDDQIVDEIRRLKKAERMFVDAVEQVADMNKARFALQVIAARETTDPANMAQVALDGANFKEKR